MDVKLADIAMACVTECERQYVGLDRLAALLTGYAYAIEQTDRLPTEGDLLHLAGVVEPTTMGRYRRQPVVFAHGGSAAAQDEVPGAVAWMFALLDRDTDPTDFVRALLAVHPFVDGNGRVAFVLHNWLRGTLADPGLLPDLFGEEG